MHCIIDASLSKQFLSQCIDVSMHRYTTNHVGTLPHFYGTCSPPKIMDVMTTKKGFKYNHLTKPILHAQMPGLVTGVPYCHPTTLYLLRKTLLSTRSTFRRLSIIAIKEEETANYLFPSQWFVLLFHMKHL